jgi:hypothetical protein
MKKAGDGGPRVVRSEVGNLTTRTILVSSTTVTKNLARTPQNSPKEKKKPDNTRRSNDMTPITVTATNIMTPRPPRPTEYSPRIQPDCSSSSSKPVKPNCTRSKPKINENLLSRAAAKTPRCGSCRARARAAHRVIRNVGREVRTGRSNEVYDGRD